MFLCISANPAIDKRMRVARLLVGQVNRASAVQPNPGGKAAHVAMVLRALEADPLWIGFAGGASGMELDAGLREIGIRTHPVTMAESTRENLEILDGSGGVTEILEPGGAPTKQEVLAFQARCETEFAAGGEKQIVIISGSLPPGMEADWYSWLIREAHARGCTVFLDTSGEALRSGLAAGPDFVKPNRHEAEELTGIQITDSPSARNALHRVIQAGAKSAAISLGENGLVYCSGSKGEIYFARPPKVNVKSTVGCGDATVAGFAYAAHANLPAREAVLLAAACGTANCLADAPGRVSLSDIQAFQIEMQIEEARKA
ncbi:MAG TPA: 1-phosphofructokinase family hexose kinase [Candidatus Saccharimonadales bacterium]|nr:1-phosphofructokinase family hexose kinase [Candidatus Saccharimonadales bacterium]